MKRPPLTVRKILLGLGSLLAIQMLVSWPPMEGARLLVVFPETWILVSLVGLAALLTRRISWPICFLAATWFTLLATYRVSALLFDRYFGRPFDLKFDVWMWYNLTDLIQDTYGLLGAIGIYLATGLSILLVCAALTVLLGLSSRPLGRPAFLTGWVLLAGVLALLSPRRPAVTDAPPASLSAQFLHDLAELYHFRTYMDEFDSIAVKEAADRIKVPRDLALLEGLDVFVIFVESYGRCAWDAERYRRELESRFREFETLLEDDGYALSSRFAASPAFGGGSWLAHASFMSGLWIDNNIYWERILTSHVRPLPGYFRDRGYETVSVMPAMNIDAWPEGAYYEFTRDFWQKDFAYDHHGYDWSPMPDQFVLFRFQEDILEPAEAPVFAELVLTSSHAPFSAIPPYHEGEWTLDAMMWTLRNRPMRLFKENTYQVLPRDVEGFSTALDYSLRSIVDFLVHRYDGEALVVLLGDHQPIGIMPGTETNQVPVHIISRRTELAERFRAEGFAPGWSPREDQEIFFLNEFLPVFLRATSSPGTP